MDLTTKGHGGVGPYIGLCTIVASFGIADATVKGGLVGDLSLMCPEIMQVNLISYNIFEFPRLENLFRYNISARYK